MQSENSPIIISNDNESLIQTTSIVTFADFLVMGDSSGNVFFKADIKVDFAQIHPSYHQQALMMLQAARQHFIIPCNLQPQTREKPEEPKETQLDKILDSVGVWNKIKKLFKSL